MTFSYHMKKTNIRPERCFKKRISHLLGETSHNSWWRGCKQEGSSSQNASPPSQGIIQPRYRMVLSRRHSAGAGLGGEESGALGPCEPVTGCREEAIGRNPCDACSQEEAPVPGPRLLSLVLFCLWGEIGH